MKELETIITKLKETFEREYKNILLIDDLIGYSLFNPNNYKTYKEKKLDLDVYAVDGGSAIIVDGGSWLISKFRVGFVKLREKTKEFYKEEYYYLIILGKDTYYSYLFKINRKNIEEVKDFEEPNWYKFLPIEGESFRRFFLQIPSHLMKLFEFNLVKNILENSNNSLVLEDSILYIPFKEGLKILEKCEKIAKNKNNPLVGISKTSRFRTEIGRSIGFIYEFGEKLFKNELWYYYPIWENKSYPLIGYDLIAKLNRKSDRAFRIQIVYKNIEDILGFLAYLSSDLELIGYPYPLMIIDRFIRITNKEKELERLKVKIMLRKLGFYDLIFDLKSQDFHSELDKRAH